MKPTEIYLALKFLRRNVDDELARLQDNLPGIHRPSNSAGNHRRLFGHRHAETNGYDVGPPTARACHEIVPYGPEVLQILSVDLIHRHHAQRPRSLAPPPSFTASAPHPFSASSEPPGSPLFFLFRRLIL